ncbi:MAG: hypothetical protein Q8R05_06960 [Candidatus Omnitrophota bacterium]|nr:hypothetical protein [Candidatus Omnitrophota bacterium]
MLIGNRQKEFVYKICFDVLNGKIKTFEEIRKIWPKELLDVKFFYEIFDALPEYFVGLDINKGEINENSWEFLDIYVALKLLEYNKDIDELYRIYKNILKIKNLTKDKVDENLKEILGNNP